MLKPANIKRPSPLNWHLFWGIVLIVSLIWSFQVAGLWGGELVNPGGMTLVWQFLSAAFSPDWSLEFLQLTLNATLKTMSFAVCGTFLSVVLGTVGGLFSSEIWWLSVNPHSSRSPRILLRAILAFPRSIHEALWGVFFVNIFGLDPLVAVVAIALPFGAIVAKVFSDILDETPRGTLWALLNSGVDPGKAFLYTIFPQAFLNLLSYTFYRLECSIRSAAVLGTIGAGGLGYEIFLSLQALRYEQVWTLLIALFILTGLTDIWSSRLRHELGAPSRLDLNLPADSPKGFNGQPETVATTDSLAYPGGFHISFPQLSAIFAVILIVFSFVYIDADYGKLWSPRTFDLLGGILEDALPPQFGDFSQLLIFSKQTLAMSILAMALAGVGGIFLSFLASNNLLLPGGILDPIASASSQKFGWGWVVLIVTRFALLFSRAVPEPIWALIFLFVLFPGILPGAIALGLHNLGILGRLMAEVTENLEQPPLRALASLGADGPKVFLYGILPRTLPSFLAYILYRWEVCIRSTAIVGLVGAGGLGRLLAEQLSSFNYGGILGTLTIFVGLTVAVDSISNLARKTIR
ncbi:MAG: PhnE/PtxC family ABC transporter permease [Limnospira sp.]